MKRIYKYRNGIVHVTLPESCDRELLKKVTEEFLKKVIREENQNGYSNTSRNFREK